jgi:hypothetical protein
MTTAGPRTVSTASFTACATFWRLCMSCTIFRGTRSTAVTMMKMIEMETEMEIEMEIEMTIVITPDFEQCSMTYGLSRLREG